MPVTRRQSPAIAVVAYNGVGLLDVTGPLEVFTAANVQGADYVMWIASPGARPVHTRTGTVVVPDRALDELEGTVDTLIVAGGPDWESASGDTQLVQAVARVAGTARRVASVCTGAFILAAAGILDGRRATTHWRHTHELATRYPRVTVEPDAIFIQDGSVTTSAGVSAGIDLALSLVEQDLGVECAREVARDLVVFMQRPGGQSQFSTRIHAGTTRYASLRRLLDTIASNPAGNYSLEAMAEVSGFSVRHFCRVFREEIGCSAADYVMRVRVEAARDLLEAGDDGLDAIARKAGFDSRETMRRAFVKELGVAPGSYRERFRTTGAAQQYPLRAIPSPTRDRPGNRAS
ncbi:MAG TPA: GlxA family transcriptional regulator [Streptosporangiaceae bacterium]|jgi:transcriptional regulator GlxA family with amidase domain